MSSILLLVLFLYPYVAYQFIKHTKPKKGLYFCLVMLIYGLLYMYCSTVLQITFSFNILDIVTIHLFLFSLLCSVNLILQYYKAKLWIHITVLIAATFITLTIYSIAFGPAEACGQDLVQSTQQTGIQKITHAGYQYGLMDYGSRFITYNTKYGFEKITGIADNANYYYGDDFKLKPDLTNHKIIIEYYNTYYKIARADTLFINTDNTLW